MKKVELLVPVGNKEALLQAVHNGADAVYLSGKSFGARAYAENFNSDELIEAIKYCHLYGVKVYVTVNTLIYDEEFDEALEYLKFLHENGVDAVIIQDVGLIMAAHNYLPNLELHASTQMHNIDSYGLKELENLGIKRAVLARELSLEEIVNLETNLELEVFIHGALCICYSGQCLFSSRILKRSGNRGKCAGMCRLPYELYEDENKVSTEGDYLLSPRELMTLDRIPELLSTGKISSFKIEGRMKSPEYVGLVTRMYRHKIDQYYYGYKNLYENEDKKKLRTIFNREYTRGHLFNEEKGSLMNIKAPNHLGIPIGQIIDVTAKKIKIKLHDNLSQNDGVRFPGGKGMIANFIYRDDLLINEGNSEDIIELDNIVGLNKKGTLYKTSSVKIKKEFENIEQIKIPIEMFVSAKKNMPLGVKVTDGKNVVSISEGLIEEALNAPVRKDNIEKQMLKLNDTPFTCTKLEIEMDDDIFVPLKSINEARRKAMELLKSERENIKKEIIINNEVKYPKLSCKVLSGVSAEVSEEETLLRLLTNPKVVSIYTENKMLYEKYKENSKVYYKTSRVSNNYFGNHNIASTLGALHKSDIVNYYLNVTNIYSLYYFLTKVKRVTLSTELTVDKMERLYNNFIDKFGFKPALEVPTILWEELMIMKHCPVQRCSECKKHTYYLKDRNNKKYRLKHSCKETVLYNYELLDNSKIVKSGLECIYRCSATNDNISKIESLISMI